MNTSAMPTTRPRAVRRGSHQQGAATLIVVMVLFFVMSLVAAYSSRNIIFEQRTSSNMQVANVVQETADAGMEWVLSLVNSGNITDLCVGNADPAAPTPSFRQRYLSTDTVSGNVSGSLAYPAGATTVVATCGFDAATQNWACACPADGTAANTPALSPAFGVRFVVPAAQRPGVIRAEIVACARSSAECLAFKDSDPSFCRGTMCALIALHSGLKSPPTAAVMARGAVNAPLTAINAAAGASSKTVIAGGDVDEAVVTFVGPPGTPPASTYVEMDPQLSKTLPATAAFTAERMFAAFFGVWPSTYDLHPGAVAVPCAGGCNSQAVRDAAAVNPDRILLLQGDVALDGGGAIGSATNPVLLVVQGNLTFSAPTDVYGFVYARQANWVTSGAGRIIGGAASQGSISGTGAYTIVRDSTVLNLLRQRTGSFVKVPGSWVDFQP
ncbi:MAG: hypothetical protein RLZZ598_713 [Pseudomonadota bacterium]|jgi:Tfp pilus assembly protein PilX